VFLHLFDDPGPFLLDEVDVFLLLFFVVFAFEFVFDLLHGVGRETVEFLFDLRLHVAVVLGYLGHLVGLDLDLEHRLGFLL
jgi:hypothetical protein